MLSPAAHPDNSKITQPLPIAQEIIRVHGGDSEPGIGLAISGGGARGMAIIGILKVLERENIKINFIAGVSMGSIIGGLYSCGYTPDEIEKLVLDINWGDLLSPTPLRSTLLTTQKGQSEKSLIKLRFQGLKPVLPRAVTSGQKLSQLLENLTSKAGIRSCISFDYLNPPLRIICTDLLTGEEVVLSSGNLSEAMRASMAVPVAFTPVEINGRVLADGGLVDPIPVDIVKNESDFPVIAIDVSSGLLPYSGIIDIVDIADQTTTIMSMDKKREAREAADLCIIPDLKNISATDFSNPEELIKAGKIAAEKVLPELRKLIEKKSDTRGDSTKLIIVSYSISGLTNMPKTLFSSGFRIDTTLSRIEIENNLRHALESGYLSDAWAEINHGPDGCSIEYHLLDNLRIDSVSITGADMFLAAQLYDKISSRAGMVLNSKTVESDRKALESYYIDSGFSLARVKADFDTLNRRLTFAIDEGKINKIVFEGTKKTRNWVISRHIPFRRGEVYKQKKAEKAIDEIFSTGLFETAKFVAIPETLGLTLVTKVVEKPYNYIRSGARFDLEYDIRAFVDLVSDNIFGGGQEMYLSTVMGEKIRSVTLNYRTDRVFRTLFTSYLGIGYGEFKQNRYIDHKYEGYIKQISYGGEFAPGRQIPQLGTMSLVGELRRYSWDEPGKSERQNFSKIGLGFKSLVDTRDALSFPERGKYHKFYLQFASDLNDGKRTYTRFENILEAYYKLNKRLNIHPRFTLGISSDFMPYFDEFTLGGLNNFLGLYKDEYLGDKIISGSVELRQRVGDRSYILTRYNAGNVWNELESVKLTNFMHGGGIGLGIKTPVGPAQVWYGRTSKGLDLFYFDLGYEW